MLFLPTIPKRPYSLLLLLALVTSCSSRKPNPNGVQFIDIGLTSGLKHFYAPQSTDGQALTILQTIGHGAAFLDFDNDGNLDVLIVDNQLSLFKGDGKGHFTDVSRQVGLDKVSGHFLGCAVGDYDNDGYEDIYVSGYRTGVLLHNESGKKFKEATATAGLKPQPWGTSCGFADVDGDGKLDLFICNYVKFGPDPAKYPQRCEPLACPPQNYNPEMPVYYHNLGGGRFADETQSSGFNAASGKALGVAFTDYDGDGKLDVYFANDEMPGDLFRNLGNGRFENVATASGTAYAPDGRVHGGMGVDWADCNGDGRPDLFVTTYTDQVKSLYLNSGQGVFTDVAKQAGIAAPCLPFVGFGTKWLDYDNDGWLDLFIANGNVDNHIAVMFPDKTYPQPMQLLRNLGGSGENVQFVDVTKEAGAVLNKPIVGRGIAIGDFDNDGRSDVLVTQDGGPVLLLHNVAGKPANWLGLRLVGSKSNRDALGARVTVEVEGRKLVREVQTAGSYLSASDKRLLFGLGKSTKVDRITVQWPGGKTQSLSGLALNQYHEIIER